MLADMKGQLVIGDVKEWATVNAAAERLKVSRRTIMRMIDEGTLTRYFPRFAGERPPILLSVAQVDTVGRARELLNITERAKPRGGRPLVAR